MHYATILHKNLLDVVQLGFTLEFDTRASYIQKFLFGGKECRCRLLSYSSVAHNATSLGEVFKTNSAFYF